MSTTASANPRRPMAQDTAAQHQSTSIDSVLQESRSFPSPAEFSSRAHIKSVQDYERLYAEAERDPEAFWGNIARELHWFKTWDKVLEWKAPWAKWFVGGQLNLCYNCVDRHVQTWRKNKAAIVWEGEPGDLRTLTYQQLHVEVQKFANVLKSLGVAKGDRVAIYMGMVPELPIAMLACARIGAVHSVVFGGFAAEALRDRIIDAEAKVLITADGAWRRGQTVPLKKNADDAVAETPSIEHVVVVRRTEQDVAWDDARDRWYHDVIEGQA